MSGTIKRIMVVRLCIIWGKANVIANVLSRKTSEVASLMIEEER